MRALRAAIRCHPIPVPNGTTPLPDKAPNESIRQGGGGLHQARAQSSASRSVCDATHGTSSVFTGLMKR